jgi:hypothetical protein
MKAWRVTIRPWGIGFVSIWPGETRGKAISAALYSARDCYDLKFTDIRAVRAPEFDGVAQETVGKMPWCLGWRDGGEAWGVLSEKGV